jgi:DUF4097 and DUF4098 domain-containing protein YvlB
VAAQLLIGCSSQNVTTRIQIDGKTIRFDSMPGSNQVQETVQQRVAAERVDKLDLDTSAGDIDIQPNDDNSNTILIRATKVVTGRQAVEKLKPYLAKIKVTQQLEGNTLLVRAKVPEGALPNGVGYYVSYAITAPKRLMVALKSVSGDVKVESVCGGIKAETSSGGIALKAVAGPVELQTVSGDVSVQDVADVTGSNAAEVTIRTSSGAAELKNITGRFDAHSISGDITVEGAKITDSFKVETSSGALKFSSIRAAGNDLDLHLTSVSGDIAYEGDVAKIEVHTSSGSAEITATEHLTLKEVKAESISGNLSLKLPGLKSAQITAHSVSGSLELPKTDTVSDDDGEDNRRSATVKLGDGAAPVTLSTSSGDIALEVEH